MTHLNRRKPINRNRQSGALTMFSAVLILILLTELILYATQVGIFEQRKSANELDQKQAFHTADSAIQVAKQFFAANVTKVSSDWLPTGSDPRWLPCGNLSGSGSDPCYGESIKALRDNTYYYSVDDGDTNILPLDPDNYSTSTGEKVTLYALLCMLEIDKTKDPIVQGCTTSTADQDSRYFMVTVLARGEGDCNNGADCRAEALVSEKIGSFSPGAGDGGPGAPLTARTAVPLSGTVEIVANPNGGGTGVPISSWVNASTTSSCALTGDAISPDSGSYTTCEAQEWYGVDIRPDDFKCPTNSCSCDPTQEKVLTYAQGADREMGPDIVQDPNFPCDVWQEFFAKTPEQVKDAIRTGGGEVLTDCSSLDENSEGVYWISGPECDLKTQIGSENNAVFLISAASNTKVSAGAELFGALMVTDAEDQDAQFTGNGNATIYGAAIMDAEMDNFNGTFQIVYVDVLAKLAFDIPLFGPVAGGWTDFHAHWR